MNQRHAVRLPSLWVLLVSLWIVVALAGCTTYRIDIQQGNVVTQEMVAKLKPGMTRSQVKFVMGTPLVADVFHPNRWDYFYKFDKAGRPREQRTLTLVFDTDALKQIVGDVNAAPGLGEEDKTISGTVPKSETLPKTETGAQPSTSKTPEKK